MAVSIEDYQMGRRIGKGKGDLFRDKLAAEERVAQMQFGEGGTYDRRNAAEAGIAKMQFETGGSAQHQQVVADMIKQSTPFNLKDLQRGEQFATATMPYNVMNSYMNMAAGYKGLYGKTPPPEGGSISTPTPTPVARPSSDVISSIWDKERMSTPYKMQTYPDIAWGRDQWTGILPPPGEPLHRKMQRWLSSAE